LRRKQISTAVRDGSLALLLGFSVAIGGWNIGPHGLSSFGGYRKQRSRTGREGTRDHLRGVARRRGSLQSTVVYWRLLEEGVVVPGYQMSAILNSFKVGGLITAAPGPQREEDVREHGHLLIRGVRSDLCQCS
jgi:hypothetical protein